MKKYYLFGLTIFAALILILGTRANADDTGNLIQSLHNDRAQVESRLGIDPTLDKYPWAPSYYDDLEDHYEQVQLVRDDIDRGLPAGPWWTPSPS